MYIKLKWAACKKKKNGFIDVNVGKVVQFAFSSQCQYYSM